MMVSDKCFVKGCKRFDIEVIYYGKPVCSVHWVAHCAVNKRFCLRREFGIKESFSGRSVVSLGGVS
jgi:hypothetical protein